MFGVRYPEEYPCQITALLVDIKPPQVKYRGDNLGTKGDFIPRAESMDCDSRPRIKAAHNAGDFDADLPACSVDSKVNITFPADARYKAFYLISIHHNLPRGIAL